MGHYEEKWEAERAAWAVASRGGSFRDIPSTVNAQLAMTELSLTYQARGVPFNSVTGAPKEPLFPIKPVIKPFPNRL